MATITLSRQELKTIASGLHKLLKKHETNARRKPWNPSLGERDLAKENIARVGVLLDKVRTIIENEPEEMT